LAAYNSLLAVVKLEQGSSFEEGLRNLEEAKQTCLSTVKPDEHCHVKSQQALKHVVGLYDRILDEYKKRLPKRPSSTPRM